MSLSFEEATSLIQYEYQQGPWKLGYRFLYTPRSSWEHNNGILILGINPGGSFFRWDASSEQGNAYLHESWKSQLQKKFVQFIFDICKRINHDPIAMLEESVTSNLIPWVAPTLTKLPDVERATQFGLGIWEAYLEKEITRVVISIGSQPFNLLTSGCLDSSVTRVGRNTVLISKIKGILYVRIPYLGHWASHCDHPDLLDVIAEDLKEALV